MIHWEQFGQSLFAQIAVIKACHTTSEHLFSHFLLLLLLFLPAPGKLLRSPTCALTPTDLNTNRSTISQTDSQNFGPLLNTGQLSVNCQSSSWRLSLLETVLLEALLFTSIREQPQQLTLRKWHTIH